MLHESRWFSLPVDGGLNENSTREAQVPECLVNIWETIGEGHGDITQLEEGCHWEWALRFQKPSVSL